MPTSEESRFGWEDGTVFSRRRCLNQYVYVYGKSFRIGRVDLWGAGTDMQPAPPKTALASASSPPLAHRPPTERAGRCPEASRTRSELPGTTRGGRRRSSAPPGARPASRKHGAARRPRGREEDAIPGRGARSTARNRG